MWNDKDIEKCYIDINNKNELQTHGGIDLTHMQRSQLFCQK